MTSGAQLFESEWQSDCESLSTSPLIRAVLTHGNTGNLPGGGGSHDNLCLLCTTCFLMFKYWFCWKYQYNKSLFYFIDHLPCYSCEWLCRYGPQCTALQGAYDAVKTVLPLIALCTCMSFEAVLGNKEFEMTLTGSKAFNFLRDMVYQYYSVRNSQKYLVVIWTT